MASAPEFMVSGVSRVLTDAKLRAAKAQEKPYKLGDGHQLYLRRLSWPTRLARLASSILYHYERMGEMRRAG